MTILVVEIGEGCRAKNAEFVGEVGLPFVRVGNVGNSLQLDGPDELPIRNAAKYGPKISRPLSYGDWRASQIGTPPLAGSVED